MVNSFLSGALRKTDVNAAIDRYATQFFGTQAGEKLKAKVQSIRDYSARVVERIGSYRNDKSDPVVREAEQPQFAELKRLARELVVMPNQVNFAAVSVEQLKRSSGEITDDLVDKLSRANIPHRAEALAQLKLRATTARTTEEKARAAASLYSLAGAAGIIPSRIVLCSCVNSRTRAVLYSFFTEEKICHGSC